MSSCVVVVQNSVQVPTVTPACLVCGPSARRGIGSKSLGGLIALLCIRSWHLSCFRGTALSPVGTQLLTHAHHFTAVWARERCRISPPHFLAECRKRWPGYFVFVCYALFAVSGLCLVFVSSVFSICLLSCILLHEPTWMALYSLQCNRVDVPSRIYSFTLLL